MYVPHLAEIATDIYKFRFSAPVEHVYSTAGARVKVSNPNLEREMSMGKNKQFPV